MAVLEISKLNKIYGKGDTAVQAVNDVSFSVEAGEIVLIMGPSGSGKTTLLTMLGGLLTPSSGHIQINNIELTSLRGSKLPKIRLQEIGFVFQSFNILENLTAKENVQIVGQLAGLQAQAAENRSKELLRKLHMEHRLDHTPNQLSGGQQQRVAIARALVNDPELILADEPTGNLDSKSGHEVMMLFHNIAKEEGKSVIIVSHDPRIKDIADRILWIEDGKITDAPPEPAETIKDPVCGMQVDIKYAPFTKQVEKNEYKFCSEDCMKKFVEHPYKYVDSMKATSDTELIM